MSIANFYYVCPTYVGMNRYLFKNGYGGIRMPHVCGDEPKKAIPLACETLYAPRMWG